jgi:hypothetical protein
MVAVANDNGAMIKRERKLRCAAAIALRPIDAAIYTAAATLPIVIAIIRRCAGTQFCPRIAIPIFVGSLHATSPRVSPVRAQQAA